MKDIPLSRSGKIILTFAAAALIAVWLTPNPPLSSSGKKPLPQAAGMTGNTNGQPLSSSPPAQSTMAGQTGAAASPWVKNHKSMVRLISGDRGTGGNDGPSFMAGVQIRLAKGWKTYWRSPGETGTPPEFNWKGTRGVRLIEVLWPAPKTFREAWSTAIGYEGEVILPLKITPSSRHQPVHLALDLNYGICADICVPGQARMELDIAPRQNGLERLLESWQAKTPHRLMAVGEHHQGMGFEKITTRLEKGQPAILVTVRLPMGSGKAELLAETHHGEFLPAIAGKKSRHGQIRRFIIRPAENQGWQSLAGKPITLTLAAKGRAVSLVYKIPARQ